MNDKQVMVITGTRKGIGKYLAQYYVKKGFIVFGCSRGPVDYELENYHHFCLDVCDEVKVKKMFSEIRKSCGSIDVLINNAGIASMNHILLTPLKTAENILKTNVLGTFLFSREAAKLMQKKKRGRIINFVTFAIPFKLEGEAIYAASKAAVATLTEVLGREFADFGITVNAVAPPAVKTDLIRGVPEEKLDKLLSRQAIHRYGECSEVANVIDFFIKPESDMVTGQIVYLGGV
ncbi:MAG: SDR family oxidoreductase [Candidatus Schekmanbacteria bacterium]|nr:SDR family oxidoreductase [Candidatus Schekmanbacteria bacterium]